MRKYFALVFVFGVFLGATPLGAQSAHESFEKSDSDFMDNTSKFTISSPDGNYLLGFKGHFQHDNVFTRVIPTKKNSFETYIQRARLKIYGNAFDPAFTYFFQAQFDAKEMGVPDAATRATDESNENWSGDADGTSRLRDYYVNIAVRDNVNLRIGKFRTPFSRRQLLSTAQMQFRSQDRATDFFQTTTNGRDIGLMVHDGFNQDIEYALALVSNGIVGRIGYNYGGIDGYETADFVGGPLRAAIALNGFWYNNWNSFANPGRDLRAGTDFIIKCMGFATNGHFYYKRVKKTTDAAGENQFGAGIDLGYMLMGQVEPVGRYSWMQLGSNAPHQHEITGGVNYYVFGHHLKAHVYGGVDLMGAKVNQFSTGVQFQFAL